MAFVGGVDVTSNGFYPVIEQNGLAVVGGIPANLVEQRSPNAFSFSGGAAAFMAHAAENGAERVVLAYGDFESFEVAARGYAAVVGESLGLEVELVPFSLFATDYLPILTKAQDFDTDTDTDTVIVLAADDAFAGVIFNSEGPVTEGDVGGEVFQDVIDCHATEPANASGTVGFRGFMNLYAMLLELVGDNISSASLMELARNAVDQPSFWGHPYTCDGLQVPGLPALCAPQQILFTSSGVGEEPIEITGWIPTDELFAGALG